MSRKPREPVFDDDNPEWTKADFAAATHFPRGLKLKDLKPDELERRVKKRGLQKSPTKIPVSIRLSREVVKHFKAKGPGWQSRIDEAVTWCEKARDVTPAAAIFRSFLASGYALQGDIKRAVDELAAARALAGDNRYSSIARLRTVDSWGVPQIRALVESTYFAGLRKAGVSET